MAPIISVSDKVLKRLDQLKIPYNLEENLEKQSIEEDFIYIPSINLYVAKERSLLEKDWFECQKALHSQNQKMLNMPEFVEFLKYTKENNSKIYNEITEIRDSWRAEWIDADFKTKGKDLYVNYHVFDKNGKIIRKSQKLNKNTLMQNKTPGISLEDWIKNPTKQGFPRKNIEKGNLYYWAPGNDNDSVAGFYAYSDRADLDCNWGSSYRNSGLGVRSCKKKIE